MEKKLTRVKTNAYFYKNGKKIEGFPPCVSGDLSDCAITDEDRAAGVDINDLIDSAEPNAQALPLEKKLTRVKTNVYFYKDGKRIEGFPPCVSGNLSNVSGNLTGVRGNLTGVRGDLSEVSGDLSKVSGDLTDVSGSLTGVSGDLTGVWGDLSDCAITDEERAAGVDINDLIDSAEPNAQALREPICLEPANKH